MEIDLKKAISLIAMPSEWFNTDQKIELRNKAREVIRQNKDMQNIFRGKATEDDWIGTINETGRSFGHRVMTEPDLIEAYKQVKMQQKWRKRNGSEMEGHEVDKSILRAQEIAKKYLLRMTYDYAVTSEAELSIKYDYNSATRLPNGSHSREEGTVLDGFEKYLTSAVTELEAKRDEEKSSRKNRNEDFSQMDADIKTLQAYLSAVQELKKKAELLETARKECKKEAEAPVIQKQNEYYESIRAVCEQLGYKYESIEFSGSGEEYFAKSKRPAELERIFDELAMHLDDGIGDKKYVKQIPSYKTPTEGKVHLPDKDDGDER